MENLPCRKAVEELETGREFATQLRRLVLNPSGVGTMPSAQNLADKVLASFSNTLLLLNLPSPDSQMQQYSSCVLPAKSDDSEDSCKSTSAVRERRGSYKRRRTLQTSEIDSEAPIDDGYAWRKYGQKNIMNATYPRNYFRCSHRFEQGCQATKQVQRVQEEPELYRTTYYGQHTCNRNSLNNEIILDANSPSHHPSLLISFDNNLPTEQAFLSSSPSALTMMTRKECKEEIPSCSSEDHAVSSESDDKDPISDMLCGDFVFGPLDYFDG